MNSTKEKPGIFDNLFDDGQRETDRDANQDDTQADKAGDESVDNGKSKPVDPLKKIQELETRLAAERQERQKAELAIDELRDATESMSKIRTAITGEEDHKKQKAKEMADREAFINDPYEYNRRRMADMQRELEEKYAQEFDKRLSPINANMTLDKVKKELSKKYSIDWDDPNVDKKMGNALQMIHPDVLKNNPRRAVLLAAHLSGSIKGKADDIPFVEQGGPAAAQRSKNAIEKEIEQIKKGIKSVDEGKFIEI